MVTEEMAITLANSPSTHFSFPPPRGNSVNFVNYKKIPTQLELNGSNGRINAWVELMKASSPTHKKPSSLLASPVAEYENWMVGFFF